MAISHFSLLLLSLLASLLGQSFSLSSPYFSPTIIFRNYQNMLDAFKIFIYSPAGTLTFSSPAESLFYSSLLNSSFVTQNAEEAQLFFLPFPSDLSMRSIARLVNDIRTEFPYWNRTLGADHFYISCEGVGYVSDRNLVELKKNSVQISCFPTLGGKFIPHKDVTLPPLPRTHALDALTNKTLKYLGYVKYGGVEESTLFGDLGGDPDFYVESEPSDQITYTERLASSKFCLFEYGCDISGIGEALRFGCVPVVITERPIQDMPLMDVLTWRTMAVFVGSKGGAKELKRVLESKINDNQYDETSRLCTTAGQHFTWNDSPQPFDSFHMVIYQLWLRRHTIRYARSESV